MIGHRLLEVLQAEGRDHFRELDGGVRVVARVSVDPQPEIGSDRFAHRPDAVAVGLDAAADLDLRRAKSLLLPAERLFRSLIRRQNADPRVEKQAVFHGAAKIGVN